MSWNYRIIFHDLGGDPYYALHEVHYDNDGKVIRWSENPASFVADSKEELVDSLILARRDSGSRDFLRESDLLPRGL